MIERYTLPEMGAIWTEEAKFQSWLQVEIAATEANAELGRVPAEAVATIRSQARFSVARILEIEAEVRHDVIAFLTNVNEHVGDAGRYIHVGMTSSDVLDTGLALQLRASVRLLLQEQEFQQLLLQQVPLQQLEPLQLLLQPELQQLLLLRLQHLQFLQQLLLQLLQEQVYFLQQLQRQYLPSS